MKSYVAMVKVTNADLSSKDLVKKTVAAFEALQPVIEFINEAIGWHPVIIPGILRPTIFNSVQNQPVSSLGLSSSQFYNYHNR